MTVPQTTTAVAHFTTTENTVSVDAAALPVPAVVVVEDIETSLPGLAVRPCIS